MKRIEPGTGQESVWDYPRPPRLERVHNRIRVLFNDITLADSTRSYRILETSHPPVYYIPSEDILMEHLKTSSRRSFCEWKGSATYYHVRADTRTESDAAWTYLQPNQRFSAISGYIAFYPSKMDTCYVDEERVRAQEGDFYGGWITSNIVGPFKGTPGTMGW